MRNLAPVDLIFSGISPKFKMVTENTFNKVFGTFTSEKISKIRWKPEELQESLTFLTGSWDNKTNHIKLWTYTVNNEDLVVYPFVVKSLPFNGDVTELKFINSELAVASSSLGFASLLEIKNDYIGAPQLNEVFKFENLHKSTYNEPSPCTALSVYDEDIVTVGENGQINLLNARNTKVVDSFKNTDSCSLKCVSFLKHNEVLTGNLRGEMKIWDVRSKSQDPVTTFMLSGENPEATCLVTHPTQRHIVLCGSNDGAITVWDLRHNTYPVNLLNAHTDAIAELMFHPHSPDKLFSASVSGELWQWNSHAKRSMTNTLNLSVNENNIWLSSDLDKDRLKVMSLIPRLTLPINSLDIHRDKILCGCDNEAFYIIVDVDY